MDSLASYSIFYSCPSTLYLCMYEYAMHVSLYGHYTSVLSFVDSLRVQLRDGSNALEGRVFYWRTSSLRRVCDDYFSSNDASVICRQLGFGSLIRYYIGYPYYQTQQAFGYSYSTSYWLWRLQCDGTELFLHHCRHGGWSTSCSGYEDAGVQCNCKYTNILDFKFSIYSH